VSSADLRGKPYLGPQAPKWRFARGVRATAGKVACAAYRVRFIGWDRVPHGGAILAGNHVSYLDPMLLWCRTPRPLHFVAKAELWEVGWLGWTLDHFWAFPVRRGTADREMISTASALLGNGELLGMFPEGTRNRDNADELGEAHGGVAFLALRADVPVVPVGIAGTDRAWPPGKKLPSFVPVVINIGEPVCPSDFEGTRKEKVEAMTAEIMRRIALARDEAREALADAR